MRRYIFSYLSYIFIVLIKKRRLLTFQLNIHVFIYFDDNNKMKNRLIIFLVKNKFLTGLFKEHINKHNGFHEKIHQKNPKIKQSEDLD